MEPQNLNHPDLMLVSFSCHSIQRYTRKQLQTNLCLWREYHINRLITLLCVPIFHLKVTGHHTMFPFMKRYLTRVAIRQWLNKGDPTILISWHPGPKYSVEIKLAWRIWHPWRPSWHIMVRGVKEWHSQIQCILYL